MEENTLRPFKSSEYLEEELGGQGKPLSATPSGSLDISSLSDDESSDEELSEIEKFFTGESSPQYEDDDQDDLTERKYVAQLVGEEGDEGLSISRFEGWLGKAVLLQGKIFLTKKYFLFYAHLPPPTLETLRASPLAKRSMRGFQKLGKSVYRRYWVVLRMGSLSWYQDPSDIYFPRGVLALNQMSCVNQDPESPEKFVVTALNEKTYSFKADSRNAAHEWVKALQKEIFRARNGNVAPAAVVRIPLKNIFYMNMMRPLDIVKLINLQVLLSKGDGPNSPPTIGNYTFAFFGDGSTPQAIVNRVASATNDLENQKNVKFATFEDRIEVDLEHSQFGPIDEGVYDTTPPSQFNIFNGQDFGDDKEMLVNVDSASSDSHEKRHSRNHSGGNHHYSPSTLSRSGSRIQSILGSRSSTPTNSYSRGKSKINIIATLNEKLHKLKTEGSPEPSAASSTTTKSVSFGESTEASDSEDADSGYSEDSEDSDDESSSSKAAKFLDDTFLPFIPQNFTRKLLFGSLSPSSNDQESIGCDSVRHQDDLDRLNKWFRDHFGLEPTVNLLAEYICTLRKPGESSSWSGKLFVSNEFLCFERRVSGNNWRMVIPMRDIIHITEESRESTKLEFEVAETAYSVFRLGFSEAAGRRDAESMIKSVIKDQAQREAERKRDEKGKQDVDADCESRFLEYNLRSARLATYEPSVTSRLRHRIPPLLFDPASTQYKEIFLQKPMKTLKFVMLMIGSRGDVQPYIALCQGLMEEGHKCCIATHKEFKEWVEGFGIEFREIAGNPSELMEVMISHGSISYSFIRDALAHFKGWLKELMHSCWEAMRDSGADVLIESPSAMIGIHIAEALQIPYFRAFTMPWTRTKVYPQALIAPDQKLGGGYNLFTYVMYDRLVWFGISKYVNRWRKKHLNLPETDLDLLRQEDVPFLYCVSPTVLVPPLDQPDWVHTCGYWELRNKGTSKKDDADTGLIEFIEKARSQRIPLAYIGFGSIIVTDPQAMTNTVVDATREAGVYCVLARGWSSRSSKNKDDGDKSKDEENGKKEPIRCDHIYEVDSVSHQWLFPRVDVCVHHGGSGTTGASLRAGKPTIIKPFFGDQYFYGRRVEDLGVGHHLKKLTTSSLSSALKDCVTNKQMIRQASVLGEQIRHEHGVEEAILSIYRELAYAEDITTRRRKMTADSAHSGPLSLLHPSESWLHPERSKTKLETFLEKDMKQSWFSLPKFGRREEERNEHDAGGEIDVSV